jgi:hypothetical protein
MEIVSDWRKTLRSAAIVGMLAFASTAPNNAGAHGVDRLAHPAAQQGATTLSNVQHWSGIVLMTSGLAILMLLCVGGGPRAFRPSWTSELLRSRSEVQRRRTIRETSRTADRVNR